MGRLRCSTWSGHLVILKKKMLPLGHPGLWRSYDNSCPAGSTRPVAIRKPNAHQLAKGAVAITAMEGAPLQYKLPLHDETESAQSPKMTLETLGAPDWHRSLCVELLHGDKCRPESRL